MTSKLDIIQRHSELAPPGQAVRTVLFENDDIKVISLDTGSRNQVFVTFGHAQSVVDEDHFWGDSFFEKRGISAVGFVPKWSHWFVPAATTPGIEAARAFLAKFAHVTAYGYSKGGYAVLKNAPALKADRTLCLSPQISIAPDDVGNFDTRFINRYDRSKHGDMLLDEGTFPVNCLLVYDPQDIIDHRHILHIKGGHYTTDLICPWSGHATISVLTECGAIQSLLTSTEPAEVLARTARRWIRAHRRQSVTYLRMLATGLKNRRRPNTAINVLRMALALKPDIGELAVYLGTLLTSVGCTTEALDIANAVKVGQDEAMLGYKLACLYHKLGDTERATELLHNEMRRYPRRGEIYLMLWQCLREKGDDGAEAYLDRAIQFAPQSATFYHQLALGLVSAKRYPQAIDAARKASRIQPANKAMRDKRLHIIERFGSGADLQDAMADWQESGVLDTAAKSALIRVALKKNHTETLTCLLAGETSANSSDSMKIAFMHVEASRGNITAVADVLQTLEGCQLDADMVVQAGHAAAIADVGAARHFLAARIGVDPLGGKVLEAFLKLSTADQLASSDLIERLHGIGTSQLRFWRIAIEALRKANLRQQACAIVDLARECGVDNAEFDVLSATCYAEANRLNDAAAAIARIDIGMVQNVKLLAVVSRVHERLGDLRKSLLAVERYLSAYPADHGQARRMIMLNAAVGVTHPQVLPRS